MGFTKNTEPFTRSRVHLEFEKSKSEILRSFKKAKCSLISQLKEDTLTLIFIMYE